MNFFYPITVKVGMVIYFLNYKTIRKQYYVTQDCTLNLVEIEE